jgi:hypothetical protein
MSVFNTDGSETEQDNQTEQVLGDSQPQLSFLNKLVETKGEHWRDPETLAKGKLEADSYINDLESQLAQLREDLSKQDYAKTLLEQLQNKATETTNVKSEVRSNNNNSGAETEGNTSREVSEDTLKSLVEQTLTERERNNTVKQNLDSVNRQLEDKFGTEAKSKIERKSRELGISVQRMQEIASESPSAFFTLIGEQVKPPQPMVSGSIRTEGVNMQKSDERNWAWYQNLRRTNKNEYYSPKVQQQILEDRKRLGDKFGL